MKFSDKMCLMIILKVTKNQGFTLSSEDTHIGQAKNKIFCSRSPKMVLNGIFFYLFIFLLFFTFLKTHFHLVPENFNQKSLVLTNHLKIYLMKLFGIPHSSRKKSPLLSMKTLQIKLLCLSAAMQLTIRSISHIKYNTLRK